MGGSRSRDERLTDLLEEYLRQCETGASPDPRRFCESDPDLRDEFLELVEDAEALDFLADDLRRNREALPSDPLVGALVGGKFLVERLLGRGGMGAVYAARHQGLDRPVAVKLLGELRLGRSDAHARFQRESLALGRLRHRDIVAVIDHGEHEGRPFFAMELIDGIDLHDWLRFAAERQARGAFRPHSAALRQLVVQLSQGRDVAGSAEVSRFWERPYHELVALVIARVARALEAAHGAGVLHRDVKPSNIMLTADGRVLLSDFGLAVLEGEHSLTRQNDTIGTPAYMAPEQVRGDPQGVDARADIYSLGATLYHLISFRTPFEGTTPEVLSRLRLELPPDPRRLRPEVPRDLEAICLKAMEKRPRDRYATAADFAADLEAFVARRSVSARRPGPAGRLVRWTRRRPMRAALYATAFALLLVGSIAVYLEHQNVLRARREERLEIIRSLPPLLTLEADPSRDPRRADRDPTSVGPALDRLLELEPGDAIHRFLRASYRSQRGDTSGAQHDLEILARTFPGSPLLERIASAMTRPDEEQRWKLPVLEELPEARSAYEHFLRGYLALRWRDRKLARAELDRAIEDGGVLYAELRDFRALAALAQLDRATALEDAYAMEQSYGRATARTRHVVGAALYLYGDDENAERALRESIEIQAESHAPWHNLGLVLRSQERLEEARAAFEHALRLRPGVWNTRRQLCQLLRDVGDYEVALALLDRLPSDLNPREQSEARLVRATIEKEWWARLGFEGRDEAAAPHAARAREILEPLTSTASGLVALKARVNLIDLLGELGEIDDERALELLLGNLQVLLAAQKGKPRWQRAELEDPSLLANIALRYRKLGRLAESEVFYRMALAIPTCPVLVHLDLIDALCERGAKLGDYGEARRTLLRDADLLRPFPRTQMLIKKILEELSPAESASFAKELQKLRLLQEEQTKPGAESSNRSGR